LLAIAPGAVIAQGASDLTGTWAFTVSGLEPHPRCGTSIQQGVLEVERRVTEIAYRGRIRAEDSYENCQGAQISTSMVTIRLKNDNLVTLEYDEEGWEMDRLRLVDGVMRGSRGKGVSTLWERVGDEGSGALSAEQLAALEAFLAAVEPDLAATLGQEYTPTLVKSLRRTGLDEGEAAQVAAQTVSRMTSCMLVELRKAVVAQEIPVAEVLEQQDVTVVFDPQSVDMRANTCIQDAAWNAGVRIR
jgi:hypothetical protein